MTDDAARGRASLGLWLERRAQTWQALSTSLARRERRDEPVEAAADVVRGFRSLGRDLSLARAVVPESRLRRDLEALYVRAYDALNRPPTRWRAQLVELFRDTVPAVVLGLRPQIAVATVLLLLSGVCGWLMVMAYPGLVALVASPAMIEGVENGELWTDGLLNVMPSSVLSLSIMTNNIAVSLTAFVLGALYGLGTVYILTLNGLLLGAVFAFTHQHAMAGRLFEFIIAHGVVELSVICLAGAAGLRLGEALVRPGNRSRPAAFRDAVREASQLLPVIALFLVGAGLIEGNVSPDPAYGMGVRTAIGVGYGVVLWAVLVGWPFTRRGTRATSRGPR